MAFTHLHLHTEYSLLDGLGKIKDYVARAKALGMTSLAITDHGVANGLVEFYSECKAQGIKPILGCEFYEAPTDRTVKGNASDDIVFTGRGAGMMPTASAVGADIIDIAKHPGTENQIWEKANSSDIFDKNNVSSKYYVATAASENDACSVFGKISPLSSKDGELSFITEKTDFKTFKENLEKLEKKGKSQQM